MTKEESIDWLCWLRADLNNEIISTPWNKEFTEALTAILEQESSDDVVSRQAVLDIDFNRIIHTTAKPVEMIKQEIKQLPSVKPQTGHWITHREHCENLGVIPSGLGSYFWCSECDCGIDAREWHRNNYNYCPNCGAKMSRIPIDLESEVEG